MEKYIFITDFHTGIEFHSILLILRQNVIFHFFHTISHKMENLKFKYCFLLRSFCNISQERKVPDSKLKVTFLNRIFVDCCNVTKLSELTAMNVGRIITYVGRCIFTTPNGNTTAPRNIPILKLLKSQVLAILLSEKW